jgi:tRNA 2-thiouridine synthesizing protein A
VTGAQPTDVVDARGLLCVQVLLLLRQHLDDMPAGATVTVATDDPAAPIDLPAWCHLTGHTYLGPAPSRYGTAYRIRVAQAAAPVDRQRPWVVRH